jgi:hypothetical protein
MAKKLALVSENVVATNKGDMTLVAFYVDKELLAKIDEHRWTNRIEGRAETLRQMVVKAYRLTPIVADT